MESDTGRRSTTALARAALLAMQQRHIPPTPENYLIWYHVSADSLPALSRLVRVLDTQAVPYDDARNWELYERFFGRDREHSYLRSVGDRVQTQLAEIAGLLGQIAHGTRDYGERVDDVATTLELQRSPVWDGADDLSTALDQLRGDTHRLIERTDHWERRASAHADEVSRLKQDLDAARMEAETDTLTGVGNRKRFDRRFREVVTMACEEGSPLSLILLDIDHFKEFNDTYGHQLGDRVLTLVAKRILDTATAAHELFRYGGEEFAMLAPDADVSRGIEVGETVRKAVAGLRIARKRDSEPLRRITVSVGVSEYEPGEPLTRVLERADAALYAAKNSGRNCTSIKRAKRAATA